MPKGKATREEIVEFLDEFRSVSRPKVDIDPRNLGFLISNNLVLDDAYKVILEELDHTHYDSGPEDDYNKNEHPEPFWIFKIKKFEKNLYIKLKIYTGKLGQPCGKCLSFHD